ncbi:MAG TPA: cadherin domain-containing protein [Beijerinckiaceae bacterium]|jgi:Ca2+-binding RTX toxin-like protein
MATFIGLDDNPTYIEDGPQVVLDDDAVVTGAPPTYDGTTLTLARDGGASPDDVFGGSGTLSLEEGQVYLQEIVGNDTVFVAVGTYSNVDGALVITFNANATQPRVNAVLEQITYGNASDGPPPSVLIDFTFDDGVAPATGNVTVNITGVNDAPELGSVSPVAAYRPGTPGVVLSPAVTIADRDSTTLVGAEVRLVDRPDDPSNPETTTDTPDADDVLSANPGGTGIIVSYNPATHVLTLSGTATLDQYRQVLDTVAYSSTDPDPSQGGASTTRTIQWELNDGGAGNNLSAVQTTILHFTPSLDLDGSAAGDNFATAYTEGGAAAPVADTDAAVTNGGANLTFATVTLTNAKPGDNLSIAGPLPAGITGSVNTSIPGQIIVSLGGSASPASYQTALRQVVFTTNDNPDAATLRDITVVVGDDTDISNTAHATIAVTAVNDPPSGTDKTVTAVEDTEYVFSVADFGFTDPESNAFVAVRIVNPTPFGDGSFRYNGATVTAGQIIPVADIAAGKLTYLPPLNVDHGNVASFTFQVQDNGGTANGGADFDPTPNTITIGVSPVNDTPTDITVTDPLSVPENSAVGTPVGRVFGSDVEDFGSTTYSLTDSAGGRFAINPSSGQITVANGVLLDYEQSGAHSITVRATDSGGLFVERTFTVPVVDVNPETASGSAQGDTMVGGGGDDYLTGNGGNDHLFGQAGADTVLGGDADDYLNGGADDDLVFGNDGNDTVLGDAGNDYLNGGLGDDLVMGGDGNDTVLGDAGNDYLHGGDGDDLIGGSEGDDILIGDTGNDYMNGGIGNDIIGGGPGNDTLLGEAGNDYLSGSDGNDIIGGDEGNDTIFAGSGSDYLVGGSGDDHFIFDGAFQSSVVVDFTPGPGVSGHDVIQFGPGVFTGFDDMMAHAIQSSTSVLITTDGGAALTLVNVQKTSLTADDFAFG